MLTLVALHENLLQLQFILRKLVRSYCSLGQNDFISLRSLHYHSQSTKNMWLRLPNNSGFGVLKGNTQWLAEGIGKRTPVFIQAWLCHSTITSPDYLRTKPSALGILCHFNISVCCFGKVILLLFLEGETQTLLYYNNIINIMYQIEWQSLKQLLNFFLIQSHNVNLKISCQSTQ